jgi:hypothetical protein
MNNTLKAILLGAACGLGLTGLMFASATANQTVTMQVNAICVLAATGNPSTLTVTAPAAGGADPVAASDNATYAQYTSTVPSSQTRKLTAAWGAADAAPAGCSLKLTATPPGGGNRGSSAGQITLTSTAQDVVSGIGSCATGVGGTDGAQLAYSLAVTSVTSLVAGESKSATVTLTLTDAS